MKKKSSPIKTRKVSKTPPKKSKKKMWMIFVFLLLGLGAFLILWNPFCYSDDQMNCKRNCEYGYCKCQCFPKCGGNSVFPCAYKPIIYLYPTEKTNVIVELGKPENLMFTYPKYQDSWQVQAEPNGNLKDLKTGRNLYALYWEGMESEKRYPKEGFIVAGKDTIPFLEEKLAQLGLNEREADEFIIYWLPKLEQNPYNFIRFKSQAEQDTAMPLNITPTPDTVIRVMMEFDEVDNSIPMRPQQFPPTPVRSGFTVVEWGGMETDLD